MKKKTRATRGPKRRTSAAAVRKAASQRAGQAKKPVSRPRPSIAPNDAKPTIRRLRTELARALKRIEELQASANTDFLLDIPNRRGFWRGLERPITPRQPHPARG